MRTVPGHLIVDGYNLAHAWKELRPLLRRRLDAAAERILQQLRPVHDFLGWELTIVFDGRGEQLTIAHPDPGDALLTVVYSASGQTADAVIERLLARAPSAENWRVASDDRALAQTALSYGAEPLSIAQTLDLLERVEGQARDWIRRHGAANEGAWKQRQSRPR